MTDPKANAEPSMEEILASIRQIINSGDEAKPAEAQTGGPDGAEPNPEDILELTEELPPEPAAAPVAEEPKPAPLPPPSPAEEKLPPPRESRPRFAPVPDAQEGLLSARTEHAAAEALSRHLSGALHHRENLARHTRIGDGSVTIESIVHDMLRPLLRDWLDAHLPGIVESVVQREVSKVVRRAEEEL